MDHSHINEEAKIISPFEPDTLLSAQYFERLRTKTLFEPREEDAINCFQINVTAQIERGKKAEEWILQQDEYGLFSFESVCGVLGLNPEYVRRGLLRWKDKELAQHRSHESGKKRMVG